MVKRVGVFFSGVVLVTGLLPGCANMTEAERSTGTGAAIGAVAGAVIGNLAGHNPRTGAVIGTALGAGAGYLWSKNMQSQKTEMERVTKGTGVAVSQTSDNQLKLDIPGDLSFDTGHYDIKPGMRPVLDRFARTLAQHPAALIRIVGHTDSSGNETKNEMLSVNRAAAIRNYLVERGIQASHISIDGRGSHEPVASNETAEGRAANRRVEIFVSESAPV